MSVLLGLRTRAGERRSLGFLSYSSGLVPSLLFCSVFLFYQLEVFFEAVAFGARSFCTCALRLELFFVFETKFFLRVLNNGE